MSRWPGDRDDWSQFANLTDEQRRLVRKPDTPRFLMAAVLIAAGVLLFLGNLGILPIHDIWIFWPAFPIFVGVGRLVNGRTAGSRLGGVVAIIFGVYFLLSNFGWVRLHPKDDSWPISLLLVFLGLAALVKVLDSSGRPPRAVHTVPTPATSSYFENSMNDFVLLGALKRKLESQSFAGGDLVSIFGSIEMDLRRSLIAREVNTAILNTTAVFGSIKIRVPQNWRVHVSGTSILGSYEDKTIPPSLGPEASTLVITGLAVFGSVEIED